jgi:alkane 1-monooxygenase
LEPERDQGKRVLIMMRQPTSLVFAAASLMPATLIILAAWLGSGWAYLALFGITLAVILLDKTDVTGEAGAGLATLVGAAHFAVLGSVLANVGDRTHFTGYDLAALLLAAGLYLGQVSNACAHELIHRSGRRARVLGTAIYCSILNGQHVSAHLLVHHVHAGTASDPNSAPLGRGFYRYFLQATGAEFRAGWAAENRRRQGRASGIHPYAIYLGGAGLSILAAAFLSGLAGVLVLLGLSFHAQMQLLLSDYLQHYGLRRRMDPQGRAEPMGPQHSWNAPRSYSASMMLNAPLHSDHHMNPSRAFPDLRHDPVSMPTLPYSVPVMGAIALVPPLWRRLMDPRARAWSIPHGNVTDRGKAPSGSATPVVSD